MDKKRAKEIMRSDGVIEVLYEGNPVWIENVLDNNNAAVSRLNTNQRFEVPVSMLVEGDT